MDHFCRASEPQIGFVFEQLNKIFLSGSEPLTTKFVKVNKFQIISKVKLQIETKRTIDVVILHY